jgi:hypothetical protein
MPSQPVTDLDSPTVLRHASAPELEELIEAVNKVCTEKSGTGYVKQKAATGIIR